MYINTSFLTKTTHKTIFTLPHTLCLALVIYEQKSKVWLWYTLVYEDVKLLFYSNIYTYRYMHRENIDQT